jgi:hypothetical protein
MRRSQTGKNTRKSIEFASAIPTGTCNDTATRGRHTSPNASPEDHKVEAGFASASNPHGSTNTILSIGGKILPI